MNVFEFAMKMENDAEAYYKKLAQETNAEGIRNIFLDLAADEKKHFEIFQAMKARTDVTTMEDSQALDNAKNAFVKMIEQRPSSGDIQGDVEAYEHAMKMEAEGARVYEQALERETNPEVKALLKRVIEEEHKHFNIIRNVYDFVNAPNEFLAWREFSNLEEFRNFGRDVGA
ncbi:Rubrerythrin [Geoalkalibacter ferrihydriticus]|uniref:Rubrerythrin diiron-binding domain-containing protein n=2 Tax=Geoalkalibacter ferrihydriticus TaxID=392333 RepID=A0A0C2HVH3_9BACT|nr:ferritin family protein [Geoalkalibacter ferrihydriticus]KIH76747.1 hypothetical protein GFER_06325 [Geoalkalibacter ferrihydriticus DSM 17813]SDL53770.1 Rubrerythrin [Geoalkalibacter ferrihydriticus]